MDFIDEPINKNKKPPRSEDDDSSRGPSTSKSGPHSRSTSNQLHAFSGNRCSHCDDIAKSTDHVDQEHKSKRTQKPSVNEQSEMNNRYEIGCRNAIHNLLQMDCDKVFQNPEQNGNFDTNDDRTMDIPHDAHEPMENNFSDYRRRVSYEWEDSGMSENSNSRDSLSPTSMGHTETNDNNNGGQCSFSKFRRRFRKNISNFVAWSSTPKLNETYDMAAGPSIVSKSRTVCSERKKYYKCEWKS